MHLAVLCKLDECRYCYKLTNVFQDSVEFLYKLGDYLKRCFMSHYLLQLSNKAMCIDAGEVSDL